MTAIERRSVEEAAGPDAGMQIGPVLGEGVRMPTGKLARAGVEPRARAGLEPRLELRAEGAVEGATCPMPVAVRGLEPQRNEPPPKPSGAALSGGEYASERRALPQQMTPEEERVLIEHLPIVRFLARRIHERLPQHVDIDDLFSAGVVGLMDAFAKFDATKKVQFRSYAQFRIRGAILDSLRTLDWSPRELRRKGRAVEEAIRTLTSRLGRPPSESEVALEMGLKLDAYQQLLGDLKGLEIGTLHLERNEDSGEEELAYIPGRPDEDPLFRCLRGEMEGRLTGAIQDLPERERLVMTLYYYEELTMREIGMALGVVESRVSQIHASAVLHLRAALSDLASRNSANPANRTRSRPLSGKGAERAAASAMPASH